jgi:hypothetical protein
MYTSMQRLIEKMSCQPEQNRSCNGNLTVAAQMGAIIIRHCGNYIHHWAKIEPIFRRRKAT